MNAERSSRQQGHCSLGNSSRHRPATGCSLSFSTAAIPLSLTHAPLSCGEWQITPAHPASCQGTRIDKWRRGKSTTSGLHRCFGLICLIHELGRGADVFSSLRCHAFGLRFLWKALLFGLVTHQIEPPISFSYLLQRLSICGVADQQPQLLHRRKRLSDAFQAGKKEVTCSINRR